MIGHLTGWILKTPVYLYRYIISPVIPARCRYLPTCSEYAIEALTLHGPVQGGILAAKRICRCHPWAGSGYDPVPPVNARPQAHSCSHRRST
ncbi:membrane protein insertion efficiency factor YidD [Alphaproteobacteria bacterium HT1-32]|nr:membrane protein insertion efficiency factor YidD [Alphaproteobacteria bacterium HT1-32]